MPSDEREIRELVADWIAASEAGNVEAILGLMTDDVVFLVPGHAPMDKEAFARASRTPPGMARPKIAAKSEIREIHVAGDWAWMRTELRVTMTPPDGAAIERAGHTLTILRKEGGRWKLARDANLLAPVDAAP